MGIKRSRADAKPFWKPELLSVKAAAGVCAFFRGDECPSIHVEGKELLRSLMSTGRYSLAHYKGNMAPKEVLDSIFNLTKHNMEELYNKADFLGGWKDKSKYRELNNRKTHVLVLEDSEKKVVGFISYRFVIIDDFQPPVEVCYIYEIQVAERNRSNGVGRCLIYAAETVARSCGAKKLMCTVLKLNTRAVAFYRNRCGFVDDESDPDVVDFERRHQNSFHVLKFELNKPSDGDH